MLRRAFYRQISRMSTSSYRQTRCSPFAQTVVDSMRKLYPESLADRSWDNTGLLLESPHDPNRGLSTSALLTIDLTKAVADEAIERGDSVVIAYHPVIFRGLKSLTSADTQQQSLLRLAQAGISVYSPHTAVDAAPGGLGNWLADIVTGNLPSPPPSDTESTTARGDEQASDLETKTRQDTSASASEDERASSQTSDPFVEKEHRSPDSLSQAQSHYVSADTSPKPGDLESSEPIPVQLEAQSWAPLLAVLDSGRLGTDAGSRPIEHERAITNPVSGHEDAGYGRLVTFTTPQMLTTLITLIASALNNPAGFPVAIPQGSEIPEIQISSVAVCAGSGASTLRDTPADLIFTGEMSHHDALRFTEMGKCVITLFHSNSERGYLDGVMRGQLQDEVEERWRQVREEMNGDEREKWDEDVRIEVSQRDRDPFGLVVLQNRIKHGSERGVGSGDGSVSGIVEDH